MHMPSNGLWLTHPGFQELDENDTDFHLEGPTIGAGNVFGDEAGIVQVTRDAQRVYSSRYATAQCRCTLGYSALNHYTVHCDTQRAIVQSGSPYAGVCGRRAAIAAWDAGDGRASCAAARGRVLHLRPPRGAASGRWLAAAPHGQ